MPVDHNFFTVDDWRADGYRWFQYGSKLIPRNNLKVKKIHFATILPLGEHDRSFILQASRFLLLARTDPSAIFSPGPLCRRS